MIEREAKIKDTIFLTSDKDDGCQYVCHNIEIDDPKPIKLIAKVYKYYDITKRVEVYNDKCHKNYKDKFNKLSNSL